MRTVLDWVILALVVNLIFLVGRMHDEVKRIKNIVSPPIRTTVKQFSVEELMDQFGEQDKK